MRAQLIDGARRAFAAHGFAAASPDDVAAEAGFTKGAVYSNFASKDELFLAVVEDEAGRRLRAVEIVLVQTGDLTSALAAVATSLAGREPAVHALFFEFWQRAVREPAVREVFVASRRALHAQVTEVVATFVQQRGISGWDAGSLTTVLLALANGLAVEALPDPAAVPPDLLASTLARLIGADPA